jgi:hypothetical protein
MSYPTPNLPPSLCLFISAAEKTKALRRRASSFVFVFRLRHLIVSPTNPEIENVRLGIIITGATDSALTLQYLTFSPSDADGIEFINLLLITRYKLFILL